MASLARLSGAALLGCLLAAAASAQRLSPEADGKTTSENVKSSVGITVTASRRYREARALEGNGDEHGAVLAYEAAAQAGHGRAQMRLAQIYDGALSASA